MHQGTSGFINVFQIYPNMFRQVVVVDNWPHWTDRNPYTPSKQTLLEELIRYLRPLEDGNHLSKHVGFLFIDIKSMFHYIVILHATHY
jgi:hypothetical protein